MKRVQKGLGFTIVELLIVVVVIAILATIVVVAFNGIQNRAHDSAVQSDLRNFVNSARQKKDTGQIDQYPTGTDSSLNGIRFNFSRESFDQTTGALLYCTNVERTLMVIIGRSKSGTQYYYTSEGQRGINTDNFGSFGTICSPFTGSSSATNARYGRSSGVWNSWTAAQ